MRKLRKVLFYLLLSLLVILVALVLAVVLYKDRIVQRFVAEANHHLLTPVKVARIDVSWLEDFPRLSIVLTDVYVEDSQPGEYPLMTAKKISFTVDPLELYNGNYVIKGLAVSGGDATLKLNNKGESNYVITKPTGQGQSIRFELKDVSLEQTHVRYVDTQSQLDLTFSSEVLHASIFSENDLYTISGRGNVVTENLKIEGMDFFQNKSFEISTHLLYDDVKKTVIIKPTSLHLSKSQFNIEGNYSWKGKNLIDLRAVGEQTDIQTLLSLIPSRAAERLIKYQSKGDTYFRSSLKGEISANKDPFLNVEFGFKNATIFHPDYEARIEDASLTGSFATGSLSDPRQFTLVLKNVNAKLNGEAFQGNFIISNFTDPEVICNFKGKIDARSVLNFYPIENVTDVEGSLVADISLEGKVEYLKEKATAQRVSTQGNIQLKDISLTYAPKKLKLEHLNGDLQFSHNDLALSDVSGTLGHSDFLLNGFFKNVITYILFDNQPIGIETDLRSAHLDLEELLNLGFGDEEPSENEEFTFSISPNVYLNFNCDIGHLSYKKFHAVNLKGDLLVKNEIAVSRKLAFESMGGALTLSGILDAKNRKAIDLVTTAHLDKVNVDSAFYVFENFQQTFIRDTHLKGKATADVNMEMTLNEHLRLFPETLIADIGISIVEGQLNNFDPIRKLNKYVEDETLSRLRFGELHNDIHIENKTIYIPEMQIRSNATQLALSGTHTFDQVIDYKVVTPLRRKNVVDVNAEEATEKGMDGQTKLFLKITGTTDDYKVAYDTEAVKKKLVTDFKKEVQELRDAFRSKGKKKEKEVEVSKDEYFEWDNN